MRRGELSVAAAATGRGPASSWPWQRPGAGSTHSVDGQLYHLFLPGYLWYLLLRSPNAGCLDPFPRLMTSCWRTREKVLFSMYKRRTSLSIPHASPPWLQRPSKRQGLLKMTWLRWKLRSGKLLNLMRRTLSSSGSLPIPNLFLRNLSTLSIKTACQEACQFGAQGCHYSKSFIFFRSFCAVCTFVKYSNYACQEACQFGAQGLL